MIDPSKIKTQTAPPPAAAPIANEGEVITSEKVLAQGMVAIRDLIAPASLRVLPDHLELNGQWVRTFFVVDYPRYINVGWFSPITNLSATMDIAMYFYPVAAEVVLNQLKKKVGNLEAQLIQDQEKGAPRDPMRETALRDIEQLRDDLTQGTEHFFQYSLYVTIYAPDQKELDNLSEKIETMF
ncbi:MAG: hypothetical protein AAB880_02345, partial [Patescibacteria group bacterium]